MTNWKNALALHAIPEEFLNRIERLAVAYAHHLVGVNFWDGSVRNSSVLTPAYKAKDDLLLQSWAVAQKCVPSPWLPVNGRTPALLAEWGCEDQDVPVILANGKQTYAMLTDCTDGKLTWLDQESRFVTPTHFARRPAPPTAS